MTVVLEGVVGSVAYGLDHAGSDIDRLGVFVAPTEQIVGLGWGDRQQTRVENRPDRTVHEVGKFLRLALKANPTITELLWLPAYTTCTHDGAALIEIRQRLLSSKAVRDSYGGYAHAQVRRLETRGDTFSADTRHRTEKHARHVYRLLIQGEEILRTGALTVRLEPSQAGDARMMGALAGSPEPEHRAEFMARYRAANDQLDAASKISRLPAFPDFGAANSLLVDIRRRWF